MIINILIEDYNKMHQQLLFNILLLLDKKNVMINPFGMKLFLLDLDQWKSCLKLYGLNIVMILTKLMI